MLLMFRSHRYTRWHFIRRGMPKGKALLPKSTVNTFYGEIMGGWEPTYDEIKERHISHKHDEKRRDFLTRSLISRVRRRLKKEDKYFYYVPGEAVEDNEGNVEYKNARYKILTSVSDYDHVTQKMWKITTGFKDSTDAVLNNGLDTYPSEALPLFKEIKAQMNVLHELAGIVTGKFEEAASLLEGGDSDEN